MGCSRRSESPPPDENRCSREPIGPRWDGADQSVRFLFWRTFWRPGLPTMRVRLEDACAVACCHLKSSFLSRFVPRLCVDGGPDGNDRSSDCNIFCTCAVRCVLHAFHPHLPSPCPRGTWRNLVGKVRVETRRKRNQRIPAMIYPGKHLS